MGVGACKILYTSGKMRLPRKALLYGFLLWLIPFVVSVLIFSIHDTNRPLFESIMPVTGTTTAVILSVLYFKKMKFDFLSTGIKVGLIWLAVSLALDFVMFSQGPMKMALLDYVYDIGITYLAIPIVPIGFGYLLEKRKK